MKTRSAKAKFLDITLYYEYTQIIVENILMKVQIINFTIK